ncbi:aldo/keto reductase [Marinobacterium zhoushanense]|uniref:Aldo/keto reductase n=2 Tax=Marinobacterium zhoushanense TaxID=1679163 RepID=A0ABQ1KE26_9GAMM|nr:aldo/keto reductase [Marinobacterium zhoushanense]
MRYLPNASRLIYGCMGLGGGWNRDAIGPEHVHQARACVDAALESGINLFDHADIYAQGKAEQVFGEVLKQCPGLRENIYLQSKSGIRFADDAGPKRYDLSKGWILQSVDGILQRLGTEYLDLLMLHRPDPLMAPEAIAEAFELLLESGKVRNFGVSNMHAHQMQLLVGSLGRPLVANQLELSLHHRQWLEEGVFAGHPDARRVGFSPGTLDYCRTQGVQLQAWGSLCRGLYSGSVTPEHPLSVRRTAALVMDLALQYQVSKEAVVLAWLMRHPAQIQPIIGTTDLERIRACAVAPSVELGRAQWYSLYVAARGEELP